YHNNQVLYPFGYGLSFTKFDYSKPAASRSRWNGNNTLDVSVDVSNKGVMDSDEVVQVYASRKDIEGSPIRTLIGFKRVHIAKGQTQKVRFSFNARDLSNV